MDVELYKSSFNIPTKLDNVNGLHQSDHVPSIGKNATKIKAKTIYS